MDQFRAAFATLPATGPMRDRVIARVGREAIDAPRPVLHASLRMRLARLATRMHDKGLELACYLLGGKRGRAALREGLFRRSGELHRWMYGSYSMRQLLESSGFTGIAQRGAFDSAIAGFAAYGLDGAAGIARKPDSIYFEGFRA